jgi:hypothetical protein
VLSGCRRAGAHGGSTGAREMSGDSWRGGLNSGDGRGRRRNRIEEEEKKKRERDLKIFYIIFKRFFIFL